ncbi:MAG: hypothetical protein ABIS18_01775, partial [Actinomycetota bacterium]
MRSRVMFAIAVLAASLFAVPGSASTPIDRYPPQPAGTEQNLDLYFGPFHVPAGQDLNRITL